MTKSEYEAKISELKEEVAQALSCINLPELKARREGLTAESQNPELWSDGKRAKKVLTELKGIDEDISFWESIEKDLNDIGTFCEDADASDEEVMALVGEQFATLEASFRRAESFLYLNGPYDSHDAIMMIYAGVGGLDAEDFAAMLLRMYLRWCEDHGFTATIVDQSDGENGGLKSITLDIVGANVYGLLKSERGTHRLVRLSPFKSSDSRQTSFASVEILPAHDPVSSELDIDPKDLRIDVYRSSGHGGQGVNTTDSAVRITHIPTNTVVTCQNERSQLQNKETAMRILRSKLLDKKREEEEAAQRKIRGDHVTGDWGSQIRSYVLHPYKLVKDVRTGYEETDPSKVFDGNIDLFIEHYLQWLAKGKVHTGSFDLDI